jgi:hypothetical protein
VLLSQKLNVSNLGNQPGVSMPFGTFSQSDKRSSLGSSLWFLQDMLNVRYPCSSDKGSADFCNS